MRFLRRSVTGVFLAAVAVGLMLFAAKLVFDAIEAQLSADDRVPPARERVFAVNVVTAELGSVAPELTAFGRIESRRTLELRAAVPGRIVKLAENFEEGGRVEAGEVLVQIDQADAQAALDRAEADMMDARAEARDAERALTLLRDELRAAEDQAALRERAFVRQQDLEARGVGTAAAVETAELAAVQARQAVISRRQAVSQAEARADQAETRVARARIALGEAQRELRDTTVTAAFSGTLQAVNLAEGRLVSENEKLAELVDPNLLEAAFRVSTVQYARLLDDDGRLLPAPVRVTLDAAGAGLTASGQLSRVSGSAGDRQTGRMVYAALDAAPGFKPGDFVTVAVTEPEVSAVARLPASALGSDGTVLVVDGEGRLEALPVELLRRQGDDVLVRGTGLAGREVVTGRTPLLGAGIRVRVLRQGAEVRLSPGMIELGAERRARLVALVENAAGMAPAEKERMLRQLDKAQVPAKLVAQLEARAGG
ncbi:efflux RND transporter periplasmic adaptor subunit [Cribrihabitans neustonicus]|uniref:efflux RND transporter periplasmic adaptor subunit n=1 Tax=Cribrihabitans neustonicus TaxID=1429085 RepID=UPI003B5C3722